MCRTVGFYMPKAIRIYHPRTEGSNSILELPAPSPWEWRGGVLPVTCALQICDLSFAVAAAQARNGGDGQCGRRHDFVCIIDAIVRAVTTQDSTDFSFGYMPPFIFHHNPTT